MSRERRDKRPNQYTRQALHDISWLSFVLLGTSYVAGCEVPGAVTDVTPTNQSSRRKLWAECMDCMFRLDRSRLEAPLLSVQYDTGHRNRREVNDNSFTRPTP